MTHYFAEDPWPVVWCVVPVCLALILVFRATRHKRYLVLTALCLAVIAAAFGCDAMVDTPAEQVDALLGRLVEAALARDADTIVGALDAAYMFGGLGRDALAAIVRRELESIQIQSLSLKHARPTEATSPTAVTADIVVFVQARSGDLAWNGPVRFRVQFERKEEAWRIVGVQRLSLTHPHDEIPLQQR